MEDNEKRFEQDIESFLMSPAGGWQKQSFPATHYDASKGLDLEALVGYIKTTQPKMW